MRKAKMIAGAAAVMMALAAVPFSVYAEDMTVTYTQPQTYTLSIPASITINEDGTTDDDSKIGVSEANIDDTTSELQINISANSVTLNRVGDAAGAEKKIKTDVTITSTAAPADTLSGAGLTSTTVIGAYTGVIDTLTTNQTIQFSAIEDADDDGAINAGTYNGTLTFTASIKTRQYTK